MIYRACAASCHDVEDEDEQSMCATSDAEKCAEQAHARLVTLHDFERLCEAVREELSIQLSGSVGQHTSCSDEL